MPATLSSHIYTMVALALVGTLLVATLNSYTTSLKAAAEIEQLQNLITQIAAKGTELLSVTAASNSSIRATLQLPAAIGYQQYQISVQNDSSSAWAEGSFGQKAQQTALDRVFLPKGISAFGKFISGYGPAALRSYMNGSAPQLCLSASGGA